MWAARMYRLCGCPPVPACPACDHVSRRQVINDAAFTKHKYAAEAVMGGHKWVKGGGGGRGKGKGTCDK